MLSAVEVSVPAVTGTPKPRLSMLDANSAATRETNWLSTGKTAESKVPTATETTRSLLEDKKDQEQFTKLLLVFTHLKYVIIEISGRLWKTVFSPAVKKRDPD